MENEQRVEKSEQRKYPRVPMALNKAVVMRGEKLSDITIGNISRSGALFHSDQEFSLGDRVTMHISGTYRGGEFSERVPGKVVTIYRRGEGNAYGLQFSMLLYADNTPALSAFLDHRKRESVSFLRDPRYGKPERRKR